MHGAAIEQCHETSLRLTASSSRKPCTAFTVVRWYDYLPVPVAVVITKRINGKYHAVFICGSVRENEFEWMEKCVRLHCSGKTDNIFHFTKKFF